MTPNDPPARVEVHACGRCRALVAADDLDAHRRWHGAERSEVGQ